MSILKRLSNSFKEYKSSKKKSLKTTSKKNSSGTFDSVTPTTSNVTSITSLEHPAINARSKSFQNKTFSNNNSDIERQDEAFQVGDNFLNCLSDYSKAKYTNDIVESYSKDKLENFNKNTSSNIEESDSTLTSLKEKLTADHEKLLQKNERLRKQYEKNKNFNEVLKAEVIQLEKLNQKLLTDNAEILHEAIKHRFLKLESEDLCKKTDQYKQKLEEKENIFFKFQEQFENIKIKSNIAYKEKEEAQLEASHSNIKLKELANDCAELDIYKNENLQRKYYFNELQSIYGNVRVYLKIKPTVGESCLSFLGDDKVLLTTGEKPKNLICQFSHVFPPQCSNKEIFEEFEPLVATVIDGYNCCFINYGQSTSGKTYTLLGNHLNPGVLNETLNYMVLSTEENTNWDYCISLSALKIYKNSVIDLFQKKPVVITDDGENLILKNIDEKILINQASCVDVIKFIEKHLDPFKSTQDESRSFSHLLIIIKVATQCKLTQEKHCGIAMFCDLAGFENENNLRFVDREFLKKEKYLQESLIDLGKTLITLKSKNKRKPRTDFILTKLLYPCLNQRSKCCLIIHTLSDVDQQNTITKSIQYGLAVMPIKKMKNNSSSKTVEWEFSN